MKVRFTPRGDLRAQKSGQWWRVNRPKAPELFAAELAEAVHQLETIPNSGRFGS